MCADRLGLDGLGVLLGLAVELRGLGVMREVAMSCSMENFQPIPD